MYSYAPEDYLCPICLAIQGVESDKTMIKQADIFYRDELVLGFIGSKFMKGHEGYPMIVPIQHVENIFDLTKDQGHQIMGVAQKVAIALKKVRNCDGIKLTQNNGPAAGQHAFHFHLHLVPRFIDDHFAEHQWYVSDPKDRIPYAAALKERLA